MITKIFSLIRFSVNRLIPRKKVHARKKHEFSASGLYNTS